MARAPRSPSVSTAVPEPQLTSPPTPRAGLTTARRSLGLKLLLVCALALAMSVPALFVFGLLIDRSHRAERVGDEIGQLMGGRQTFLGPVIAVPYVRSGVTPAPTPVPTPQAQPAPASPDPSARGVWYIFPSQGQITATTDSEVRRRSLFKVAVFEARLNYTAHFDLDRAGSEAPTGMTLDWTRAEIILGASDARGARSDIGLTVAGRPLALTPSNLDASVGLNQAQDARDYAGSPSDLRLFGAPLALTGRPTGVLDVTGASTFSGAQRIALLPFAATTRASISGDWPHPSYDGGFLPAQKGAADKGFQADWSVPFVARGVPAEGGTEAVSRLGAAALGVSFVEPANPYQSVSRSLKYAPLFIGLVFLGFFLFETTTGRRVHPAQYILIGLAQVIFYMLLLSIAEHTGFDVGFAVAAVATVGLISAYAGWTFDSRAQGIRALIGFGFLYGLIYVLMRLEDYALLVGALASFGAIAAVMYFTRKLDWYGITHAGPEERL